MGSSKSILIGSFVGFILAFTISFLFQESVVTTFFDEVARTLATIFIGCLKMIVMPLIIFTTFLGIIKLGQNKVVSLGPKIILYFLGTSALALVTGIVFVLIFKPGMGVDKEIFDSLLLSSKQLPSTYSLKNWFYDFIKNNLINPFEALAVGRILPVLIFTVCIAACFTSMGSKAQKVIDLAQVILDGLLKMIALVMKLAPIGIGALIYQLTKLCSAGLLSGVVTFVLVVLGATLFHSVINLPLILKLFRPDIQILKYFKHMQSSLFNAFSTSSSLATLPITYECVVNKLKADKEVAGVVLPLGTTINMDGTALYEAIAAVFLSYLMGIELGVVKLLTLFITVMIASIGAPGIPSAGMVTMVMVLQAVNLPLELLGILLPLDRLLDTFRTMVNVQGDSIGCLILSKPIDANLET